MAAKKIRLASYCTAENVEQSAEMMDIFVNKATKSIFIAMLKAKWTGEDTIKVPIEEFAAAVWKTYLLRNPSNKGNVKRDKKGNKVVDQETRKCIRDTHPSYFIGLSDVEKETRCMTIIKHLRKYFKIVDRKTEWTVTHDHFATATALSEEVVENILPGRSPKKVDEVSSTTTPCTRSKRKRGEAEEESSEATVKNHKRRRMSSDSDVYSSISSSESGSLVSSPDSTYYPASPAEDQAQVASPLTFDTYGDFPTESSQALDWYYGYMWMNSHFPAFNWE